MAARLEAFRGDDRTRFLAALEMATRYGNLTAHPRLVEGCLRRHRAVVEEILAQDTVP
jgi:hypothetical protein